MNLKSGYHNNVKQFIVKFDKAFQNMEFYMNFLSILTNFKPWDTNIPILLLCFTQLWTSNAKLHQELGCIILDIFILRVDEFDPVQKL